MVTLSLSCQYFPACTMGDPESEWQQIRVVLPCQAEWIASRTTPAVLRAPCGARDGTGVNPLSDPVGLEDLGGGGGGGQMHATDISSAF